MPFLRKVLSLGGCARLAENKEAEVNEEQETFEIISDDGSSFEDNGFSDQSSDLRCVQGAWRSPRLGRMVKDSPRLLRKAMSKMTSPMVLRRKTEDEIFIITLDVVHLCIVVEEQFKIFIDFVFQDQDW